MESEFTDIDIKTPTEVNGTAITRQTGKQNGGRLEPATQTSEPVIGVVSHIFSVIFLHISRIRNAMIKGLEDIYYT